MKFFEDGKLSLVYYITNQMSRVCGVSARNKSSVPCVWLYSTSALCHRVNRGNASLMAVGGWDTVSHACKWQGVWYLTVLWCSAAGQQQGGPQPYSDPHQRPGWLVGRPGGGSLLCPGTLHVTAPHPSPPPPLPGCAWVYPR